MKINSRSNKDGTADTKSPFWDVIENKSDILIFCKMYDDISQKYLSRHTHARNSTLVTYLITGKQVQVTGDVAMFISYAFQQRNHMLSDFYLTCTKYSKLK